MTKKFQAEVILTIGISNSGKSTWARQFIKENPMFTDLNRDDMRIALFCNGDRNLYHTYKFSKDREELITKVIVAKAEYALSKGQGIVVSDTNLNGKTRAFWKNFAETHKVLYREHLFDTPFHVCIARNRTRDITLPHHVLFNQQRSMRKFLDLPDYTGTEGCAPTIIFDVDGTLADMAGVRKPFEWSLVGRDKPRINVIAAVHAFQKMGYKIIIMSGRSDVCREETAQWLKDHSIKYDALIMRKKGNDRPDAIVKEEMFWNEVADAYDVKFVLDDRNQMVDAWRLMGIECWQVNYGEF